MMKCWSALVLLLSACHSPQAQMAMTAVTAKVGSVLFDDFSYAATGEIAANGWIVRQQRGWPGVENAAWGDASFSLHDDPSQAGNRVLRMSSQTDGTAAGTRQSQLCHARKYLAGTYAARVRFTDAPVSGPNGDVVVQTFYMISPLVKNLDPDYSELDHEYLPNGGWGSQGATHFNTSWESVQLDPWQAYNQSAQRQGALGGWHLLLIQVGDGKVDYFLDREHLTTHGGKVYPRVPMSLNFNLWFTREGIQPSHALRVWEQDIDWVYHAQGRILGHDAVLAEVAALRKTRTYFRDTVPTLGLSSPCNM
ncbi:glycoside hydrolase family 16 protein [Chitinibacter sp. S2-10]|uniref:glycoside hydrolase family 16 protein n=1 Tax=Chitinibacter sp. S2-10 TaxID=3373597 RepID=UPI003977459C